MFLVGEHYAHKGNNNVTWEKNLFFLFSLLSWEGGGWCTARGKTPRKLPRKKPRKSHGIFFGTTMPKDRVVTSKVSTTIRIFLCVYFFFPPTRREREKYGWGNWKDDECSGYGVTSPSTHTLIKKYCRVYVFFTFSVSFSFFFPAVFRGTIYV